MKVVNIARVTYDKCLYDQTRSHSDLAKVRDGVKPLAVIYRHKTPALYAFAQSVQYVKSCVVREGVLVISLDEEYIRLYKFLISSREYSTRVDFQKAMGTLLGYSEESIAEFVESKVGLTCTCIECGGEIK